MLLGASVESAFCSCDKANVPDKTIADRKDAEQMRVMKVILFLNMIFKFMSEAYALPLPRSVMPVTRLPFNYLRSRLYRQRCGRTSGAHSLARKHVTRMRLYHQPHCTLLFQPQLRHSPARQVH